MARQIFFLGTVLSISLFFITGCNKSEKQTFTAPPPVVTLGVATPRNVTLEYTFTGKTEAFQTVDIVPRVRGFIKDIYFVPGEIVEPGDSLFKIQDFDYKIGVAQAYAKLKSAVASRDNARNRYQSSMNTNQRTPNTVTQEELVQQYTTLVKAEADIYTAQADYQYQQQQLYYTNVVSPIRGKIGRNLKDVGNLVDGTTGNPPVLTTVVGMDPIYVYFQITDKDMDYTQAKLFKETGGIMKIHKQNLEARKEAEKNSKKENPPAQKTLEAPIIPSAEPNAHQDPASPNTDVSSAPENNLSSSMQTTLPAAPEHSPSSTTEIKSTSAPGDSAANKATSSISPVSNTPNSEKKISNPSTPALPHSSDIPAETVMPTDKPTIPSAQEKEDVSQPELSGVGIMGELTTSKKTQKNVKFKLRLIGDPENRVWDGIMNFADNKVDPYSGTIMIRGEVSNPNYEIFPGRICTITMQTEEKKNVIVVPERAVCNDLNSHYLWVISENNQARRRYVILKENLPKTQEYILHPFSEEVVTNLDGSKGTRLSGLKPGEHYIVDGIQKVREGRPVSDKSILPNNP